MASNVTEALSQLTAQACPELGDTIHPLSMLLGFGVGVAFTLVAAALGIGLAFVVNYNVTRRLRREYRKPSRDTSLVHKHHFPEEMDAVSPGVISHTVRSPLHALLITLTPLSM